MREILKGNFKVKRPVDIEDKEPQSKTAIKDELKKKVLSSLGGSMVYVERNKLNWDGHEL